MNDDVQFHENEVQLVHTAMRLARRVSRALGTQRRPTFGEAEREAILREAFEDATDAEMSAPVPAAPKTHLVPRAGWRQNEAGQLEMGWCMVPDGARRVRPRLLSLVGDGG